MGDEPNPDLEYEPNLHDYHQSRPRRQMSPIVETDEAAADERERASGYVCYKIETRAVLLLETEPLPTWPRRASASWIIKPDYSTSNTRTHFSPATLSSAISSSAFAGTTSTTSTKSCQLGKSRMRRRNEGGRRSNSTTSTTSTACSSLVLVEQMRKNGQHGSRQKLAR